MTHATPQPPPLPPHLERIGRQLVAAADDLHLAEPRRHRRIRRRVFAIALASTLVAVGVAAAAVVPGLVQTNQHQLYSPNSQGVEQPIDNCQQSSNSDLYICTSSIGTNVQAKDAAGQYVAPSDCTWSGQIETCQQPFRFVLDFSNPDKPQLIIQSGSGNSPATK